MLTVERLRPGLAQRADLVAHRAGHAVGRADPAAAGQEPRRRELRLRGRRQRRPGRADQPGRRRSRARCARPTRTGRSRWTPTRRRPATPAASTTFPRWPLPSTPSSSWTTSSTWPASPSAASPLTSGMFSEPRRRCSSTPPRCRPPRSSSARRSSASTGRPTNGTHGGRRRPGGAADIADAQAQRPARSTGTR